MSEIKMSLLEITSRDLNLEHISEHGAFRLELEGQYVFVDEGFSSVAAIVKKIEELGGVIPFLLSRSESYDDAIHQILVEHMLEQECGMYVGDQWLTWHDLKPQWDKLSTL